MPQTAKVEEHLRSHKANISSTLAQLSQSSTPDLAEPVYMIVPHTLSVQVIPSTSNPTLQPIVVTDMWVERCVFHEKFMDLEGSVLNMPFHGFPILGNPLLITSRLQH